MESGNQSMKTETKIEQGINLSFEGKKLSLEKEIDVLKEQRLSDGQLITKLTTELLESEHREDKLRESQCGLRVRVSNLEAEKKAADLAMEALRRENEMLKESEQKSSEKVLDFEKVIKLLQRREYLDHQNLNRLITEKSEILIREMNLKESHAKAERKLEELQAIVANLESEKIAAELNIEELRREKLEGVEIVKAAEAVEASIRKFEGFSKLLKMNLGDASNEVGMTAEDCDSNRGLKRKRREIFGAEIVRAFQEDDELCIQAVLELRQVVNSECSNNISFYHFEQLWRYDCEATRPIPEIKQRFPHIVGMCRQLAMYYSSYLVAVPCCGPDGDALSVYMVCRQCYDSHDAGACETGEGEEDTYV